MPRKWWLEPETFVAVAALIVSVSALGVGLYTALLQRQHDRAEVWPHLELATFTSSSGAVVYLENTGIGPAIVEHVDLLVDGKPAPNWPAALNTWLGHNASISSNSTVVSHALRAGDRVTLVALPNESMPPKFWDAIGRIGIAVCYRSVFGEAWSVTARALGSTQSWRAEPSCAPQPAGTDL
jgi:hypothetical protein